MRTFHLLIALVLFSRVAAGQSALPSGEITFYQHVAWSPDARQLATSAMKISRAAWEKEQFEALKKSQFDVYRVPIDGSRPLRVTDNTGNDLWATWWPGGSCLFFSSEQSGRSSFFFIKADGSNLQQMRDDGLGSLNEPSVSADGKRIAFTLRQGSESHIYIATNDLPARIKLTSTGPNNWGPVWSPDGKKILFYSNRLGRGRDQIFVVDADGSNEKQLTNDTFNNSFPSWSSDGRRILFTSNREGKGNEGIYVMNADGSNIRRLIPGVRAFFGRWSPDGKKLSFIAGNFPDTQIFLASADGSNPVQLRSSRQDMNQSP
jgi:TolB protein